MFKKILPLFIFLFLFSCVARNLSDKGYVFSEEDLKNITVGLTNKTNVLREVGYPINKSYFTDNTWIYYSYRIKEVLFFRPKVLDQKILVIEFNQETDIVKNLSFYEVDSNKFEMLKENSVNPAENENIIKDILKNIGTVKAM